MLVIGVDVDINEQSLQEGTVGVYIARTLQSVDIDIFKIDRIEVCL